MNKNVILLALCQALLTTGNVLLVSVNGLVGRLIAIDPALTTLPVALQFIGLMAATIPASLIMQRIGRKKGFYLGNGLAVIGSLICLFALPEAHFWLFCSGTFLLGIGIGFGTLYRFAAVEVANTSQESRAISLVMAGGVLAAIVGPTLALYSRHWITDTPFAGSYLGLLGLYVINLLLLFNVQISPSETESHSAPARPLNDILRQDRFLVAVLAAMSSYAVMNLIMTATPLAMERLGYSFASTTSVIKWHVLGMFAPSFFTGHLIQRFGTLRMIKFGALLILLCISINLGGTSEWHFWCALLLLGIGWNFMFISATQLLTGAYSQSEKAKAQASNEFMVFGMVTLSAFGSGWLEASIGWQSLNTWMLPVMLATLTIIYQRGRFATADSR
ncbi:MFS transporter [Sedimenticola sp.]|uniref:MFS transporter n=1 Tax=Sedimenticola sp. TaxID=1940285 RepID=UPI003D0F6899